MGASESKTTNAQENMRIARRKKLDAAWTFTSLFVAFLTKNLCQIENYNIKHPETKELLFFNHNGLFVANIKKFTETNGIDVLYHYLKVPTILQYHLNKSGIPDLSELPDIFCFEDFIYFKTFQIPEYWMDKTSFIEKNKRMSGL
jgi:hypothetical protein